MKRFLAPAVLSVCLVLIWSVQAQTSLEKALNEYTAAEATAHSELDQKVKTAQKEYDTKKSTLVTTLYTKLQQELTEETKKGNLDAALKIREYMTLVMDGEQPKKKVDFPPLCGYYIFKGHSAFTVSFSGNSYKLLEDLTDVTSNGVAVMIDANSILFNWGPEKSSVLVTFSGKKAVLKLWAAAFSGVVPKGRPSLVWEGERQ